MLLSVLAQTTVLYLILAWILLLQEIDYIRYVINFRRLSEEKFQEISQQGKSLFREFYPDYQVLINLGKARPSPIFGGLIAVTICIMMITQSIRVPTVEHHLGFGLGSILSLYTVWRSYKFIRFMLKITK